MRAAVALHEFAILANIFESFVSLLGSGRKVGTAIRPALRHPMNAAMKSRDRGYTRRTLKRYHLYVPLSSELELIVELI